MKQKLRVKPNVTLFTTNIPGLYLPHGRSQIGDENQAKSNQTIKTLYAVYRNHTKKKPWRFKIAEENTYHKFWLLLPNLSSPRENSV